MNGAQIRSLVKNLPLPPDGRLLIDGKGKPSHIVLQIKVYRDILRVVNKLSANQLETLDILMDSNWSPELEKRISKPLKADTILWKEVKNKIQTNSKKSRGKRPKKN